MREISAHSSSMIPFYINLILVALMLSVLVLSFIASHGLYLGENDWFQRSGSIIVAIADNQEYRHQNEYSNSATRKSTIDGSLTFSGSKFIMKTYDYVWKVNYVLLIIGTLVWGYGDIPF